MKKGLVFILVVALFSMTLTGCMGVIGEITLNEDATGNVKAFMGYTEDGLELMASMNGETEASTEGLTPVTYNGYTYYGQSETKPFSNLDELNALMNTTSEEESEVGSDAEITYLFQQGKDQAFTLTMNVKVLPTEETEEETTDPETEAMVEELMAQMTVVYEITFPSAVTQTAGLTRGVTIEGNKLILDTLSMKTDVEEATFVFTTAKDAVGVNKIAFVDVNQPAWYYDAVMALAEGGLVAGIGNNLFNPEGALTYAQFCQILARAKGLPTGAANDYWAYTAIESCLDAGYILDRGPVTAENFDAAIPREAAVSAMYLAKKDELMVTNDVQAQQIPDFSDISEVYQESVLAAYNSGITWGVDEQKTFKPRDTLTRAQVCQLFYNLSWTTVD